MFLLLDANKRTSMMDGWSVAGGELRLGGSIEFLKKISPEKCL